MPRIEWTSCSFRKVSTAGQTIASAYRSQRIRRVRGKVIGYAIADYESKGRRYRVVPEAQLDEMGRYDRKRHLNLLVQASAAVLNPFKPDTAEEMSRRVGRNETLSRAGSQPERVQV